MGQGAGAGACEGALEVVPVEHTMPMVRIAPELLHCHACHLPLKPPIFQCDAEHLVCFSCRRLHGEACGRAVSRSKLADAFAAGATVPCVYQKYGCAGDIVYHETARHRHAPCCCPHRCGFSGSRQMLLDHVSADHSRSIVGVRYGQPCNLSLPLSHRCHVLAGKDDKAAAAPGSDRHPNLFLVSLSKSGATTAVSLVCVRADGTGPGEPQFSCKLAVEHSTDGTRLTLESPLVRSSALSSGEPAPGEVK